MARSRVSSVCGVGALVLLSVTGCSKPTVCPPAAKAPEASTEEERFVTLPWRAGEEIWSAAQPTVWKDLNQMFKGQKRLHFYDGPTLEQLRSGMELPATVLESPKTGERLIWSQRQHAGGSVVALLIGSANEVESVGLIGADCTSAADCDWLDNRLVLYVRKGQATRDRIDPIVGWGADFEGGSVLKVIELP